MSPFVLDSSFAISWIVGDERTPLSLNYLWALSNKRVEAFVPAIWADEIANVLMTLERSKRISSQDVTDWIATLKILPIHIRPVTLAESLGEVRAIAQTHRLTVYDARYLHLALVSKVPLATFDKQLLAAALQVGVKLVA